MTELTHERLRELLTYDPLTGEFRWKEKSGRRSHVVIGSVAGSARLDGYVHIRIDSKRYLRSRLAWLYVHGKWPEPFVDHINGKRDDDRLCNLREATHWQNSANTPPRNELGVKGVYRSGSGFRVVITSNRQHLNLGSFRTIEEAAAVYRHFAKLVFGEFAYEPRS